MYYANVNVTLVVNNVTQINSGITVSVGVRVKIEKNTMSAQKVIFEILQHVAANIVNM